MKITEIGRKKYIGLFPNEKGECWLIGVDWFFKIKQYFKSRKCKGLHSFVGEYNVRASTETVEMNCIKCGKLNTWSFDEFEKLCD